MHPMVEYWQRVFADYQLPESLSFKHPHFSDPLMSPCFLTGTLESLVSTQNPPYFNYIGKPENILPQAKELGYQCAKEFSLGFTDITSMAVSCSHIVEAIPLEQALEKEIFYKLLEDGFPKDAPFLKKLLRALPQSKADYYTLFMKVDGEIAAMITTGLSDDIALVLNAVVHSSFRRQRLSRQLINATINFLKNHQVKKGYFWTELKEISQHGEQLDKYMIFSKSCAN